MGIKEGTTSRLCLGKESTKFKISDGKLRTESMEEISIYLLSAFGFPGDSQIRPHLILSTLLCFPDADSEAHRD
jgi:hypothetical protein